MLLKTKQRISISGDNSYFNAQEQISAYEDTYLDLLFFIQNQHQTQMRNVIAAPAVRRRHIG